MARSRRLLEVEDTRPSVQDTSAENPDTNVKKGRFSALLPAILAIAGILVLMYPVVASQWNNNRQNEVAYRYSQLAAKEDPNRLQAEIDRAREYNKQVPGMPILDPWLARVSKTNRPYQVYLDHLNLNPQMGRLIIPTANADLPIYHGTDTATLEKGIGHLYGSSLPVGGPDTHAVLTGHSALSHATLLDGLPKVQVGDSMYVEVSGEKLRYVVKNIVKVLPHEVDSLQIQPGQDLLTVLTCTPYGINTHRLLVTGERAPLDNPEIFTQKGKLHWSWWMILVIIVCLLALLALIYWYWRRHRRRTAQLAALQDNAVVQGNDVDEGMEE